MQKNLINLRSKRHYASVLTSSTPVYKTIFWPDQYAGFEATPIKNKELMSTLPSLDFSRFKSYTAGSFKNREHNYNQAKLVSFDKPSKTGKYSKTCWCDECGSSLSKDPYHYKPYRNRFNREKDGIHPSDLFRVNFVFAFPGISPSDKGEIPGKDPTIWPSIKCVLCFSCIQEILEIWKPCFFPATVKNWEYDCQISRDLILVIFDQTLCYTIEWWADSDVLSSRLPLPA